MDLQTSQDLQVDTNLKDSVRVGSYANVAAEFASVHVSKVSVTPSRDYEGRVGCAAHDSPGIQIVSHVVELMLPTLVVEIVQKYGLDALLQREDIGVLFWEESREKLQKLAKEELPHITERQIQAAFQGYVSFVFTPISAIRGLVNKHGSEYLKDGVNTNTILELANHISECAFRSPESSCYGAPNHRRRSVLFWTCLFSTLLHRELFKGTCLFSTLLHE